MDLDALRKSWEHLGATDPRWAILSVPAGERAAVEGDAFWKSGEHFVDAVAAHLWGLGCLPARDRALDFGCGHGRLTQALARHFAQVVGVDIAESMLVEARAANRHGERVAYVHNPDPDLRLFGDASFDFVLSVLVLQHLRPELAAGYVREIVRVLRPGGVAMLQTATEPLGVRPRAGAASSPATAAVAADALAAGYRLVPPQVALRAGARRWVRVEVRNDGPFAWRAGEGPGRVELGTRVLRSDGTVATPARWTPLPHDVEPGGTAFVTALADGPPIAGAYVLAALCAVQRTWCEHARNVAALAIASVEAAGTGSTAPTAEDPPAPLPPEHVGETGGAIEVQGTRTARIVQLLADHGAELVDLSMDGLAGPDWLSAHFVLRRR